MHIDIVLPEVKPNITVRHTFDLDLLRSVAALSIAYCSRKRGCNLVDMSLAASRPHSDVTITHLQDLLDV